MRIFPTLATCMAIACMLLLRTNHCMSQSSNMQIQFYQFDQFEENEQFQMVEGNEPGISTHTNPVVFIKVRINEKNLLLKYGKKNEYGPEAEFELKYTATKKPFTGTPQVLKSQTVNWYSIIMPGRSSEFANYAIILGEKEIGNSSSDLIVKIELRRKGQTTLLESTSRKLFLMREPG